MNNAQRAEFVQALRALEGPIEAGNVDAVKALTIPAVAASFGGIAQTIQNLSSQIQGATFTVNAMYELNGLDLKADTEQAQFFCGLTASPLMVTITIPQLPPGDYLLAMLHATGVEHPQQVSLILQKDGTGWKLAGFFARPMTLAGKDGIWYWAQARQYALKQDKFAAYFYYQTAAFLLTPVDFISSNNLEKLLKEELAVTPTGLPGADPMKLESASGKTFMITGLRTDVFSGQLDLVVNYQTQSTADPVATRQEIMEVNKALLAAHPAFRQAFHGLWVHAEAPNQQPFAIEMPMAEIQ